MGKNAAEAAMSVNYAETKEAVKSLIYQACLYQDDLNWDAWLKLCDADFQYRICAYSPEIQADMIYLSGGLEDMRSLTGMLPKHNSDHSPLRRHCVAYQVTVAEDGRSAESVSSVTVFQTQLDGINSHVDAGESRLFLVGRYHDKFSINGGDIKFTERTARLDTRRLDKGSHWPI